MKAQMSLEMVIGLLILLVVAAVVINLFLNNTKNIGIQQYKQSLQYRNFVAQCQSLCSDYQSSGTLAAAAKFCFTKLTGDTDLNRNGKVDAFPADTKLLNVCEDGLYCFHVSTCTNDQGGQIDWPDCRQILCNAYYQVYQDYSLANTKVKSIFANGVGSCNVGDTNWYQIYFGTNPCTEGPTTGPGGTTQTATQSSVVDLQCSPSGTSIACTWTCPNAVSQQNPGTLAISVTLQNVPFVTPTGTYTFKDLKTGTKYNIGLVCDLNNPVLSKGVNVQL